MKCKEVQDFLLLDDVDERTRKGLQDHLNECRACREFQEQLADGILRPFRGYVPVTPPESVWHGIREAVIAEQEQGGEQQPAMIRHVVSALRLAWRPVFAVVAVLVMMVAVAAVYFPMGNQRFVYDFMDSQAQFLSELSQEDEEAGDLGTAIEEFFL